jgi:RNA polymerase sigma factor (sigma-70 family)
MQKPVKPPRRSRRPYVVAMLLGTALSALGSTPVAARQAPPPSAQAVNDLSRYCTACWRNARLHPDAWDDCTQEVFQRLLERVPTADWGRVLREDGQERRELVRAIDAAKKRVQRSRKWAAAPVEAVADPRDEQRQRLADEREAVRQAAETLLTARQQRILQLSFEGWSVQDIAGELGTSPDRVSDDKYKAIRKLRAHLGTEGGGRTSPLPA